MIDDDLAEGRVRRGRNLVAVALAVALVGSLALVFGRLSDDGAALRATSAPTGPTASVPLATPLAGRLVYVADAPGTGALQQLVVVDLSDGSVTQGASIPEVDTIHAAGPARAWLLLLRSDARRVVAYVVRDVAGDGAAVEIARGDLISLSPDGRAVLVGERDAGWDRGCRQPAYRLELVGLATGRRTVAYRGRMPCGTLRAVALYASRTPVISVGRGDDLPRVFALLPNGPELLFRGSTVSSSGAFLFAANRRDLFVWPGGGALRLIVTGSRLIGTILASSSEGRYLAVDGRIGAQTGVWVVDVAAGTAQPVPTAGYPLPRGLSAAAFDDSGTLFASAPGHIFAMSPSAVFPVALPSDAPLPAGSVAWLP